MSLGAVLLGREFVLRSAVGNVTHQSPGHGVANPLSGIDIGKHIGNQEGFARKPVQPETFSHYDLKQITLVQQLIQTLRVENNISVPVDMETSLCGGYVSRHKSFSVLRVIIFKFHRVISIQRHKGNILPGFLDKQPIEKIRASGQILKLPLLEGAIFQICGSESTKPNLVCGFNATYNNVYPFRSKFHITVIPIVLKGSIGDMGVVAARPRKANELYSHSLRYKNGAGIFRRFGREVCAPIRRECWDSQPKAQGQREEKCRDFFHVRFSPFTLYSVSGSQNLT